MDKHNRARLKKRAAMLVAGTLVLSSTLPSLANIADTYNEEMREVSSENLVGLLETEYTTGAALQIPEVNSKHTYNFGDKTFIEDLGIEYVKGAEVGDKVTPDQYVAINGGTTMKHNGDKHGLIVSSGNSIDVSVAGNAIITFKVCQYGNGGTIVASSETGAFSKDSVSLKSTSDGEEVSLNYVGEATTLTFTINGSGYIHQLDVQNTTEDLDLKEWAKKDFNLSIAGVALSVEGASKQSEQAAATLDEGAVYYAQSEKAYVSVDLGDRRLTEDLIAYDEASGIDHVVMSGDNEIEVIFKDQTTYPSHYVIKVQDRSQFKIPTAIDTFKIDFKNGAVPVDFTSGNSIQDSYTVDNGIVTIKANDGNKPWNHNGGHGIAIYNKNTIDVVVAGDAEITFELCAYSESGTWDRVDAVEDASSGFVGGINSSKPGTESETITYKYTGEAATLSFQLTSDKANYLHSITVANKGKLEDSDIKNEQLKMPSEIDGSDSLTVTARGQRLIFDHQNDGASMGSLTNVGYYVFEPMEGAMTLEADIRVTNYKTGGTNGVFIGMFDDQNPIAKVATVGFRGDKKIRNSFTKPGKTGVEAGGIDTAYAEDVIMHVVIEKRADGWYSKVTQGSDLLGEKLYKFTDTELLKAGGLETSTRFGIALSNARATVTSMLFKDANGEILYDQNDCYEALGEAPTVVSVDRPVLSSDRKSISVAWEGNTPEGDAAYQVELSKDGGENYTVLSAQVTDKDYTAAVAENGQYRFRITGICGEAVSEVSIESEIVEVVAPLESPSLTAESGDAAITLSWNKVEGGAAYQIYRKGAEEADYALLATVTDTSYIDTAVVNEEPYYYYVIASAENNTSNPSNSLLMVPTAGREGKYVYENEAAEVFITKKSYDTVYNGKAVVEGRVDRAGTVSLEVNGAVQDTQVVGKNENFAFEIALEAGRNDVNLLFTDKEGKITRETFNFVYLTHYDIIVDASYKGEEGAVDGETGAKVYTTVQAAVDSIPSTNTSRQVILIKEGNYVEYLRVESPYITLIGEDREKVNINFFDKQLTPPGGNTAERCAIYIKPSAKGFSAENLTFENTYEYKGDGSISNESADALRVDADEAAFVNVKLLGYQDTLQANSNKQYFYKCYIAGNVDYIYGTDGQALFEDCELVFRYSSAKNSGYITAPKTSISKEYGYIFKDCVITAEEGCSGSKYLLGRPWGPDGAATFINTYMGSIINPTTAYSDMSGNSYMDARFSEYYSYGPSFAINSSRPQISKAQAEAMLKANFLGWAPQSVTEALANTYFVGSVVTPGEDKFIETEYSTDKADPDSTDDTGLGAYSVEGYGNNVTGGGVLLETSSNYYKVDNAVAFLDAIVTIKKSGKPSVIELTDDINLGSKEIGAALNTYSSIIKAHNNAPLLHPELLETGVSMLYLKDMSNLTIYSKNGASLTHACLDISNSSNIIIRNIVFDELWEWDEDTEGDYDRNDWDYMTIQNGSTDIWIDHCTFYKAYDGVVDIKKADASRPTNVTISWSKFLPESETAFFDVMMDLLEENPENYPYYNKLITEYNMTKEQVRAYASMQKKTHLVGASDTEANMENLQLTLANNYYKNSMDRMPRMRAGNAHVYNCILDAADVLALKQSLTDPRAAQKVVSNGAISTCNSSVLLENTYINGILNALISGNGSSPGGYLNAVNSLYYMNGELTDLVVKDLVLGQDAAPEMILDAEAFVASLPYSGYNLYAANRLNTRVLPYVGAGVVDMNSIQWQKTSYNATIEEDGEEVAKEYMVNLDYQGATGNAEVSQIKVTVGSAYGTLPTPIKNGYTFLGWYTAATGGQKVNASTIVNQEEVHTLYARWMVEDSDDEESGNDQGSGGNAGGGGSVPGQGNGGEETKPESGIDATIDAFTDIADNHWAKESIAYVVEKGVLKGTSETNFAPQETMTRAMFATVIHRLAGEVQPTKVHNFTDVKSGAWYENAITWATEVGIVNGVGEGQFAPGGAVTREQMAVMLSNYVKVMNIELPEGDVKTFNDAQSISSWAAEAMNMMQQAGIIQGDDQNNCNPKGEATRAEVSAMLHRFMEILDK